MSALRRFFAAEAAYITEGADFAGMAACLALDVVMYQASHLPYGGEWHGPQGIQRFMTAMSETWLSLDRRDPALLSGHRGRHRGTARYRPRAVIRPEFSPRWPRRRTRCCTPRYRPSPNPT
jgi:hypothetical protein